MVTVLISASFSTGWENYNFLQGNEHPHPLSIPSVGHHPGTLRHVEVLNTAGKVNESKSQFII